MYLELLCCWFWKRKSLFVLILSKLDYESLLLFSESLFILKLKKMWFCWKSKLPELFCIWVFSLILCWSWKKMWFCWRSKLPELFCIWFSVASLFSKIKWNSFSFQNLLLLFRPLGRLVKINYVKSYNFTSEDQRTVSQLKDFTEKNKANLNN